MSNNVFSFRIKKKTKYKVLHWTLSFLNQRLIRWQLNKVNYMVTGQFTQGKFAQKFDFFF